MKTIIYKAIILLFFCSFGIVQLRAENTLSAYVPTLDTSFSYKSSIGGILPIGAIGVSFKTSLKENLFLQTDVFYTALLYPYYDRPDSSIYWIIYPSVELNANIMYQKKLQENEKVVTYWFVGGGVNLGCCILPVSGKTGVNTIFGLEYIIKKRNLSMQLDYRYGYAYLFGSNVPESSFFGLQEIPFSHFNYAFMFTLRRVFTKILIL